MTLRTLTSADVVLTIAVAGLFDTPVRVQQFKTDSILDLDEIVMGEGRMGVDGFLSAGIIKQPIPFKIHLEATSDSLSVFEQWYSTEKTTGKKLPATINVTYPAVSKSFTLNKGFLMKMNIMSNAHKMLEGQDVNLLFESLDINPI